MSFQTRRVEVNGIAYHLNDEGGSNDRPAVLLLHGFPDTSSLWRNQGEAKRWDLRVAARW